jgi:prevent-host-death family protein
MAVNKTQENETISISEFKATCLSVLARVKRTGRPILVTRRGEPIAQVLPPPPEKRRGSWIGSMAGSAKTTGDIFSPALEEREWEVLGQ